MSSPYYDFLKDIVPDYPITHTHHIIPKSQGGTDSKDNLVQLSPAQHFYAHWLWDQEHNTNTSRIFRSCSGIIPTSYEDCLPYNEIESERQQEVSQARSGIFVSEETRAKMSEAHFNNSKTSKPVQQFTKDGQFVAEYPSAHEAERQTGIFRGSILRCLKGRYGYKTAGGFAWQKKIT